MIKKFPVTAANVESKSKEIMGKIGTLNLFEIIMQAVNFVFQVINNTIPSALQESSN